MSQWRAREPAVSARDAVLARGAPRPAAYAGGAGRGRSRGQGARLDTHARNLIPARGQLDARGARAAVRPAGHGGDERRAAARDAGRGAGGGRAAICASTICRRSWSLAPEPLLDRANWDSQPCCGCAAAPPSTPTRSGVTLAIAGVAETGTLVLASAPERPTLLAYLPETSVVDRRRRLDRGCLRGGAGNRCAPCPAGVPRSVNFVTGPSRTADIAQKLELGAHGPRRLLILIVEHLEA